MRVRHASLYVVADYLSRAPVDDGEFQEMESKDVVSTILGEMAITAQEWEQAEVSDVTLQVVKERVINGWKNGDEQDCDLVQMNRQSSQAISRPSAISRGVTIHQVIPYRAAIDFSSPLSRVRSA
ncbi:hypothetical protein NDU88_001996 [Pleurodeles waltl]|uniref:Uncharacterized protein n=1 Tax=Pleurodeles waltl TaxID=8319 RepID=A0AAV7MLD5_PLEWA|nr:hypothetical protein NDU88_001996 [Pleurodeles waltl]